MRGACSMLCVVSALALMSVNSNTAKPLGGFFSVPIEDNVGDKTSGPGEARQAAGNSESAAVEDAEMEGKPLPPPALASTVGRDRPPGGVWVPPPTALDDRGDLPPSGVWGPPPAETLAAGSAVGSDLAMRSQHLSARTGRSATWI